MSVTPSLPERMQLGELREKMVYQLRTFLSDPDYDQKNGTLRAPFDIIKKRSITTDEIIRNMYNTVHENDTSPGVLNKKNTNNMMLMVNAHINELLNYLNKQGNTAFTGESKTLLDTTIPTVVKEYTDMMYPREGDNIIVDYPKEGASKTISPKTVKESIDKVSRSVEKFLKDIDLPRARNLYEQKINQAAADEFKDEMADFSMQNAELEVEQKRLQHALTVLLMNSSNPVQFKRTVDALLDALGTKPPMEIQYLKEQQGGHSKKSSKVMPLRKWLATGGVEKDQVQEIIQKVFADEVKRIAEKATQVAESSVEKAKMPLTPDEEKVIVDLKTFLQENKNLPDQTKEGYGKLLKDLNDVKDTIGRQLQESGEEYQSHLEELYEVIQSSISSLTEDIKGRGTTSTDVLNSMKKEISSIDGALKALRDRVATNVSNPDNLHLKIKDLLTEVQAIHDSIQKHVLYINQAGTQGVETLSNLIASKQQQIDSEISKSVRDVISSKQQDIATITETIGDDSKGLKKDVKALNDAVKTLKDTYDTVAKEVSQLQTDVLTGDNSISKQKATLEAQIETLINGTTKLTDAYDSAKAELGPLTDEMNGYKKGLAQFEQAHNIALLEKKKVDEEISKLREQTLSLTGQIQTKTGEIESALASINTARIEEMRQLIERKDQDVRSALDQIKPETVQQELVTAIASRKNELDTKIAEVINGANLETILTSADVKPTDVLDKLGEQLRTLSGTKGGAEAFVNELRRYGSPIKPEELEQMMNDLRTKVPGDVVYVQDILKEINEYAKVKDKNTLDNTIGKVVELHNSLSMYKTQLQQTPLKDVRKTVYSLIENELQTLTKMVEKGSTSEKTIQDFMNKISQNKNVTDPTLNEFINNASSLFADLQEFYKTKDELFPVRIVLNFGKRNASALVDDSKINENYKKSRINEETLPKHIHNILPVNKRKQMKDQYGPYYLVTNTSSADYNVEEDIERLFGDRGSEATLPHIIYSAYGFSGAGKSYTLIQSSNPNNVLTRVLSSLQRKKSSLQGGSDLYIKYRIYDYYGEYDDNKCVSLPPNTTITRSSMQSGGGMKDLDQYSKIKTSFFETKDFRQVPLNQANIISSKIFEFEDIRKTNLIANKNSRVIAEYDAGVSTSYPDVGTEYHIRATPNNDQSSRSHLIVDMDVYQTSLENTEGVRLGRISLMDMAGSEDVDAIQRMYFKEVDTNYDFSAFTESISILVDQITNFQNTVKGTNKSKLASLGSANNAISNMNRIIKETIKPIRRGTQTIPGSFIIEKSWLSLINKLPGYESSDMNEFASKYNIYNFLLILRPYYILRYHLRDAFEISSTNTTYLTTNKSESTIDFTTIDKILSSIGLHAIDPIKPRNIDQVRHYFNYKDYLLAKTGVSNNVAIKECTTIANELSAKINGLFTMFDKEVTAHFNLAKTYYAHFQADNTLKLDLERIMISIRDILNKDESSFNRTLDIYKQQLDTWTVKYLYGVHCPIRYQGNFIMDTISSLESYLKNIQQNSVVAGAEKVDMVNFPGNKLHKDLPNVKPKFVLFTNVRLDFDPENDFADESKNVANTNFREAYINSITFSDRINPLAQDVSTFENLTTPRGQSSKPGISGFAGGSKDRSLRYKGGEEFIQRVMDGGAKKDDKDEPPVNTSDPQAVIEASKAKLGELSDIKRDLNASITAFQNMMKKVDQFNNFKKIIDNFKGDPSQENEIIGAYNYLKEEGVTIKEEFKATIDDQRKKIKNIQNRIAKIIQTELPAPAMVKLMALLVTTLEEKIDGSKKKDNKGIYNEIANFYTDFEQAFSGAYSSAKSKASAIQEQRQLNARIQANMPYGMGIPRQGYDVYGRPIPPSYPPQGDNIPQPGGPRVPAPAPAPSAPPLPQPQGQATQVSQTAQASQVAPQNVEGPQNPTNQSEASLATSTDLSPLLTQTGGINVDVIIEGLNTLLEKVVGDLIRFYSRRVNPAMSIFTADSLFNRILNDYINNRTETNEAEVRERFMNALEHNNLIPRKVLSITRMDKIIFIFITLFIRLLSTSIVTSLIERGVIKDMTWAVTGYLILYTLVMLGFVMIVNLDMYRMRIVFNYVNFHANSGKLYMHIILLYILAVLIYIVMTRVNYSANGTMSSKAISENDKLRLIMRFQILTGILWAVLALVIAIGTE